VTEARGDLFRRAVFDANVAMRQGDAAHGGKGKGKGKGKGRARAARARAVALRQAMEATVALDGVAAAAAALSSCRVASCRCTTLLASSSRYHQHRGPSGMGQRQNRRPSRPVARARKKVGRGCRVQRRTNDVAFTRESPTGTQGDRRDSH
jgi:hypothetical protein